MNKAKSAFAGIIIALVAGATALCWVLNDKGIIGTEDSTVPSIVTEDEYNYPDDDDSDRNNAVNENKTSETTLAAAASDVHNDNGDNDGGADYNAAEVNKFLSVFSNAYFCENGSFSLDNYSKYDIVKFAFLHLRTTEPSSVLTVNLNDSIGTYFAVTAEKINYVLTYYFGLSVPPEDIYTEKSYSFFMYKDGLFYTPAAEGMGYGNVTVADTVRIEEKLMYVDFTIYSNGAAYDMSAQKAKISGEKYASGTAEIDISGDLYKIKRYSTTIYGAFDDN